MLTLTSQARTYTEWSAAVANTTTHPQRVEAFNQHSAKSSELVCNMINRTIHVLLFCEERLREIVRLCVCVCVCTHREGSLTQFVSPVIHLASVSSKHKYFFCGLYQEGPGVFGTSLHLHLSDPDAVRQTDDLGIVPQLL